MKLYSLLIPFLFPLWIYAQHIPVMGFEELEAYYNKDNDTTYVVNFWATWCAPCVKELPYFERLHKQYLDKKVRVLLVSLDFRDQYESRLIPFVKKKNLQSTVLSLNAPDQNAWIPKVSTSWTGSIPATLVINKSRQYHAFHEQEMGYEELERTVLSVRD